MQSIIIVSWQSYCCNCKWVVFYVCFLHSYYIIFSVLSQPTTKLFIDGKFVESKSSDWLDIHNPVSSYGTNRQQFNSLTDISLTDYTHWPHIGQVKPIRLVWFSTCALCWSTWLDKTQHLHYHQSVNNTASVMLLILFTLLKMFAHWLFSTVTNVQKEQ